MIKMKDSRGNKSHTLGFVYIAWAIGSFAFVYSLFGDNPFGLTEYGAFTTAVLLPYVGREAVEKLKSD